MMDSKKIQKDFPLLKRRIHNKRIVYLDSTATALKSAPVIQAVTSYYTQRSANVFRGIYTISEEATAQYEEARDEVAAFIHAYDRKEIIFTRNTSESLNLLAYTWFRNHVGKGDRVVTTIMEHHSNFVPWQQLSIEQKAEFVVWKCSKEGILDVNQLDKLITRKTKLLAITAASNVLGTINPIASIIKKVKNIHPACFVFVDAAQSVPHMPTDVRVLGADAIAFSGHKMLGPSGIGVLWAKQELLEQLSPFLYGGDMIREVHEKTTEFNEVPHKFEAGTPFIEGAIGLGAAVRYLGKLGMQHVRAHEEHLIAYALKELQTIPDLTIYGPKDPKIRGGVIAFRIKGIHPHDVAQLLDEDNVCIRVGFHCAMPLHEYLAIGPTCRASFYVYTTKEDVDALIDGLKRVRSVFK